MKRVAELLWKDFYAFNLFNLEEVTDEERHMCVYYSVPNPKDYTQEELDQLEIPNFKSRTSRTDPILIQVVQELGKEANTQYSSLVVKDIPDDVKWKIEEEDGYETIEEIHRSR